MVETEVDVGERFAGVTSSSVGFAGKGDDELENPCELTMDEVIFFERHSKCARTKLYLTFGSGSRDW